MPHTKRAFDLVESLVPGVLERTGPLRSLLYVGWRHDTSPWWIERFAPSIGAERVGVLEGFEKNVQDLGRRGLKVDHVIHANVLAEGVVVPGEWDIVFWDHGPEHVTIDELRAVTPKLMSACRVLLYACPWGDWPQGANDGNTLEVHRCQPTPDDFRAMGMEAHGLVCPGPNGEVVALHVEDRPLVV